MKLRLGCRLEYEFPNACEVLLQIEAAQIPGVTFLSETLEISPNAEIVRHDDLNARRVVTRCEGPVVFSYQAKVEHDWKPQPLAGLAQGRVAELPAIALPYLNASAYCPSPRFERFVNREFSGLAGGDRVQAIVEWVGNHLDYTPGVSDAATTALQTFIDRAGVCRDYAHLTTTLCRASGIPARMVSAYALDLVPPDFHAVVEVYVGGGWHILDATGLAKPEHITPIAYGRDAADISFMAIFGHGQMVSQAVTVERLA